MAIPCDKSTFKKDDVTVLLTDITGIVRPKPAAEREALIQSGVHYSEMLPVEYEPSFEYLSLYYKALDRFADDTAAAVMSVSDKIYEKKKKSAVLVSLARAGTPAGVLIKRFLSEKYGFTAPHYTISIVRGRGIDTAAMDYIIKRHNFADIQFIDGWTGKGAILNELSKAVLPYTGEHNKRELLAVLADPAHITDLYGTKNDIPIANSFLNAAVCGLMSRTVIRPGIEKDEFHGAAFYDNLRGQDKTYEFIEKIEGCFGCVKPAENNAGEPEITSEAEINEIRERFNITDINFIKPGIAEAARVLLRRLPDMLLISDNADPQYTAHLIQLAKERNIRVIYYPLRCYNACGIIKKT